MEPETSPVQKWLGVIASYDSEFGKWEARAKKILKRYRDDTRGQTNNETAKFNILWSNVQTLVPAVFARLPKADVSRRFGDNDPVGRVAATLVERALDFEIEHYPDFRAAMRYAVEDRFLPGRGIAWVRYEPHVTRIGVGDEGLQATEDVEGADLERIEYECAPADYVHWKDFGHSTARTWEEVTCVWRWVYMTHEALVERFGEDKAKVIPLDAGPEPLNAYNERKRVNNRAKICELWDKTTKRVFWFCKGYPQIIDEREDPLGLENFFPCPRPLYATTTSDTLVPVPDFTLYQDQAAELDILSDRIDGLVKALRVRGVYDASQPALQRLLTEGENNALIPVDKWMAFSEKGGLKGSVDLLPIDQIAGALIQCYQAREQIKGQIYEITGISDIIRGQTAASETATAQQITGQYASLRLRSMQEDVALFATELLPEPDVWEGPILDLLRPENLRWDWSVPFSQIDRAAWVQEQVPMHIDLATAQFGLTPAERDQIMAKASDNERDTTGRSIRDQAEAADPDASTYEDRIQRGKIIVWDRYDRLTHRHVIFIEGLDRLLVDEVPDVMPAWGHPYVGVSANDFDGAMVPRSDVSFIRKINDAINQKLTDGQESLWASMKRYLYKKGSMDPGELEKLMGARPHDAIEVKDPAGIKEAMREIASDDWNPAKYDLEQLFRLLELVMGMSLSELGVVNTARFATEAQIANDNSQANDGRHALAMATAWKRIFEAALSMANVLLPEKTVRWLIGQAAFWPPAPTRDDLLRTLSITVNAAGSKRAARAQAASSINDAMDALTKAFDLKERGDRIGAEVNMAPLISAILRTVDVPQGARQLVKFRSALAQPQPTIPGLPAPAGNPAIAGALPAPANPGIPSTMP